MLKLILSGSIFGPHIIRKRLFMGLWDILRDKGSHDHDVMKQNQNNKNRYKIMKMLESKI